MVQGGRPTRAAPRLYPIVVEVGYKLERRGLARTGRGWTAGMSSTTINFLAAEPLPQDNRIDLSIAWPALLNGKVALRLCIQGRIVQSRGEWVSVEILKYEFHTESSTFRELPPALPPHKQVNTVPRSFMKKGATAH